jgi:hypothetical protein
MSPEETNIKGIWWQESHPEVRLNGQITYGPATGAQVDLFGHLGVLTDQNKLFERFTLHGVTFSNKPISLFESYISSSEIHLPGGRSCKIGSFFGVVGGHYHSMDEVEFKDIHVQIEGLVDWTCITGIGIKIEETPPTLAVSYHIPATIPLGTFGPFSLRLEIGSHAQPDFHSFHIAEDCTFVIQAEQMQPFPAFEKYILDS